MLLINALKELTALQKGSPPMNAHGIVDDVVTSFRENLRPVVMAIQEAHDGGLSPSQFCQFISSLKDVIHQAGREAFVLTVEGLDETGNLVEHEGRSYRFKMASRKDWLTPFGRVAIKRNYFQQDEGGEGIVPIDVRCGMVDRYMTPDVEEISTFASAMLVPGEVHTLLGKLLPQTPSVKAIQRALADVGRFAESNHGEIEMAMRRDSPLSSEGDVLVVSWDGKMVPLREPGVKAGRPPERPGIRMSDETPTAWREAGVATISIYGPLDQEGRPQRLDALYFARMPEAGMETLLQQQLDLVRHLQATRSFREFAVICDGKKTIWTVAEETPEYAGATLILDFYHAAEHLSNVAEALFGKGHEHAKGWFKKYRNRWQLDRNGVEATIRSIRYYRRALRKGTERFLVATRVIRYFTRNRERMHYADFIARGLPIGSGPVEAACKTVVGHRINRSGMRWSREGGQMVLNLRTRVLSSRWDSLWSCYMDQRATA